MTIDDDNSIYVGGIPYDSTEDSIRTVFDLYGAVVAVKIINDHGIGGKCYGFVTFTNPRSAIDAINDMNGRTIGGRVVRVNEVQTRGRRPNFNRENIRRDSERDMGWDGGRDRERDQDHDRERYRDRINYRSRDRDREQETEYERSHDRDQTRDRFLDQGRDRDREHNEKEWKRNHDRDLGRDHDIVRERDVVVDRTNDHDRKDKDIDQQSKSRTGSCFIDRRSRELSSNSSDDYLDQVKEQLDISIQKREELQKEISQIEGKLEEKQQLVSDFQKQSQTLEDALVTAKKRSSQRQMQLTKIQRCYLEVKGYTERLKSCEQELQFLVDEAMVEADNGEHATIRDDTLYANGMA